MHVADTVLLLFLLVPNPFLPHVDPPVAEKGVTAWLKVVLLLIAAVIGLIFVLFAVRLTVALVVSSLVGTAVLIAAAFIIPDRWAWWGKLLFNLTFAGIGLLIYEFVPGAGFDGLMVLACFALFALSIAELFRLFCNKRPDSDTV